MENFETSSYTANVVRKKKKTGIIIGAAAAVLVGGSGVAYAAVPVVHNTVNMTVMSPEKYCTDIYETNIDKFFKDNEKKAQKTKSITGGSLSFSIEPDSSIMALAEAQLGQEIFDKLSISIDARQGSSSANGTISLSADDKEIVSANCISFSESGKIYVQIPGLSEKYLYADLSELAGEEYNKLQTMLAENSGTRDDYKGLGEKYIKELTKIISKGTSELEKSYEGKVGDVNYKYNLITTVIKAEEIGPFMRDFVKEIKNDEKIRSLIEKIGGENSIESFEASIDETLEEFNNYKAEDDITIKTYVDPEGTIRGIKIGYEGDELGYIVAKEGKNVAFEFKVNDELSISLGAVKENNKYTGALTMGTSEEDFSVDFENIEIVDDMYINGLISMDLSEVTDDTIQNLSLSFKAVENGQNISTDIKGVAKFSIDMLTSTEKPEKTDEPENAINFEDFDQYYEDIDVEAYLDEALGKIGFTYEQFKSIVDGVQALYGMAYYDDYASDDNYFYDDDFNSEDFDDDFFSFDDSEDDSEL